MVQVIEFPRKVTEREAAIERLAVKLVAHLAVAFYEKNVLDSVPLDKVLRHMKENMLNDGFDYDPKVLDYLAGSPEYLKRIEQSVTRMLVQSGYLPDDFR
jgi:hypothetical protein